MKNIMAFLLLAIPLCMTAQAQTSKYDKAMADSLGADEYGMKNYLFVILKTGKTVIEDKHIRDSLFQGHMENIGRLAKIGKLVVAGPFGKNELTYRGLFIFDVKSREELHQLLDTDPTIKSGIFELEILDWYGSAALSTYLPNHEKVQKTSF